MSLQDAVTEVITDMEADSKGEVLEPAQYRLLLRSYARQLRAACTAAGPPPAPTTPQAPSLGRSCSHLPAEGLCGCVGPTTACSICGLCLLCGCAKAATVTVAADRASRRPQSLPGAVKLEERMDGGLFLCVGGTCDGTYVPMEGNPPVGCKTLLGQEVYKLNEQRHLEYSEKDTEEMRALNPDRLGPATPAPKKLIIPGSS